MPDTKRTKIIATIGPASDSSEVMSKLLQAGVNIFRFNTKHNIWSWHEEKIQLAKNTSNELKIPLGILIDLQGPEIRIKTKNNESIFLKEGEEFLCTHNEAHLNDEGKIIFIPQPLVIKSLEMKDVFTLEDGKGHFIVTKKGFDFIIAKATEDFEIKNNKSLNLVQKDLPLKSLTEADLQKLNEAMEIKPDFIALSFVRTKEDVLALREELTKRDMKSEIVSKIESQKGMDNIDEIIEASDAIMIARGDLGIETPMEKIPYFQKETIKKCRKKLKSVIVATQMLESMMNSTTPSRSEAGDIAGAVFDSADCTMLSGETAVGKYPVLSAAFMAKVIRYNENLVENNIVEIEGSDTVRKIAMAALSITSSGNVDKIVAFSSGGYTAEVISALRPKVPVIVVTENEDTYGHMNLNFGVIPFLSVSDAENISSYEKTIKELLKEGILIKGEKIVIVHGQKQDIPGKLDSLIFLEV